MIFSSYRPRGILHKVYTRKLPLPSLRGLCTPLLLCIYHFWQKGYPFICLLENGTPFLKPIVRCFYRTYTEKGPLENFHQSISTRNNLQIVDFKPLIFLWDILKRPFKYLNDSFSSSLKLAKTLPFNIPTVWKRISLLGKTFSYSPLKTAPPPPSLGFPS